MSEVFFDLKETICQRFPAVSPFDLRREYCGEVFLLINQVNTKGEREKGIRPKDQVYTDKKGNVHIRREAQNDNWY